MKTIKIFRICFLFLIIYFDLPLHAEYPEFHKDSLAIDQNVVLYEVKIEQKKVNLPPVKTLKMRKSESIALGILLSTAWGAYFAKKEADFNYRKYTQTGDLEKINQYWDKSKKYDRISEILLSVSYLSTGYILKKLLFD